MIKNIFPALAFIWGIALTFLVSFVALPTITTILVCVFAVLNLAAGLFALLGDKSKRFGKYFNQEPVVKQTDFSTKSYWSIVWFQFRKNKLAVFGLIMIFVLVLTAIIAPVIAHNKPFFRQDYDFSGINQDVASVYFYQNSDFKKAYEDIEIKDFSKDSPKFKYWQHKAFTDLGIESIDELDSKIWSPWYESLFDRTTFSEHVDIFFNSYLLVLIALICIFPPIFILRSTIMMKTLKFKRRISLVYILLGLAVSVFVMVFDKQFTRNPAEFYTDQVKGVQQKNGENLLSFYNKNADVSEFLQHNVDRFYIMPILQFSAMEGEVSESMQEPDGKHVLGTTATGRDVLTVMMFGLRVSLTIGVIAVSIYCFIGIVIGAFAGFFGGWVDIFLSRFIEVMICFPAMYLLLTLAVLVKEANIYWIMLIIGITRWTGPARLIRGEYLKQRTYDYVTAATALGFSKVRIMFRHVLPNAMTPLLVTATFGIAAAILTESALSYLGFGPSNFETWGALLKLGSSKEAIHLILPSGMAIFLTVMFFNFVGEGLRDALDPKLRK